MDGFTSAVATVAALLLIVATGCSGPPSAQPRQGRQDAPQVSRPTRPQPPDTQPADTGGVSVAAAAAALPVSAFHVVYQVTGTPYFDHMEVWWKPPLTRLDGTYAGYPFSNYLDTSTGTWTLCLTILGQYTCGADTVSELAALFSRLEALAPTTAAQRVVTLSERPGATTEQRTIAGVPAACVHGTGQELCIAASGAVLYAAGLVTMRVDSDPVANLTFEAVEYTTEVSDGEVTP
ncbi:MAG: hypothetical protein IT198_00565 [Acidimicrobiia bacterium]|nr:hypothetical protein [Acidimicrobiia bacterium]